MSDLAKLIGRREPATEQPRKQDHTSLFDGFLAPSNKQDGPGVTRTCGAEGCTSTWRKPWKNRNRPIFEEEWGCGTKCIEKLVMHTIRRETGEGIDDGEAAPHRHRVPLGLVLLAQGWITHPQLRSALEAQKQSGKGRIGDWLAESCGLDHQRITRGLGIQWNCPVFTTDGFTPAAMALVMPKRFVVEFGLVPLRVTGRSVIYLASKDNLDAASALAIEQMSSLKVETGLLPDTRFTEVRTGILAAESVPVTMGKAANAEELAVRIARKLEQGLPVASRLVRVHQYYWLRTWLEPAGFGGTGTLPASVDDVKDHLYTID
jgi:hypothetical protein